MKNLRKSKLILPGICFTLLLTITGIWAYFNGTETIDNQFRVSTPEISIIEVFDPADYWLPGEKKQKQVQIENTGDKQMMLRFKVDVEWKDASGEAVDVPENMISIQWGANLENDFQPLGDKYYYYKHIFSVNEVTAPVMESVTFSEELGNSYQKYQANVVVTAEMVPINDDAIEDTWHVKYGNNNGILSWELLSQGVTEAKE